MRKTECIIEIIEAKEVPIYNDKGFIFIDSIAGKKTEVSPIYKKQIYSLKGVYANQKVFESYAGGDYETCTKTIQRNFLANTFVIEDQMDLIMNTALNKADLFESKDKIKLAIVGMNNPVDDYRISTLVMYNLLKYYFKDSKTVSVTEVGCSNDEYDFEEFKRLTTYNKYLEEYDDVTISEERVKEILESHPYRVAATMPQNPHMYSQKKNWINKSDWLQCVKFIKTRGEISWKFGNGYRTVYLGDYKYWSMPGDLDSNKVNLINRSKI